MKLLLDTHILLWWLAQDPRLSSSAVTLLKHEDNVLIVSAVTLWEIWLKVSAGKLKLPQQFFERLTALGIRELPLTGAHARAVTDLPWHHRDPFDRMLVAQATAEQPTLLTADRALEPYGPTVRVI